MSDVVFSAGLDGIADVFFSKSDGIVQPVSVSQERGYS
jgi:hypothetical protein